MGDIENEPRKGRLPTHCRQSTPIPRCSHRAETRIASVAGISSRDWESYPVLRFSDVPEIAVELVDPVSDNPPLGIGEASGGPTVAAIGNAVAHALGARIRDLPMNRERVMAALLKA